MTWVRQISVFGDDAALQAAFKQALTLKPRQIVFFTDGDINLDSCRTRPRVQRRARVRFDLVLCDGKADSEGVKILSDLSKKTGGTVRTN